MSVAAHLPGNPEESRHNIPYTFGLAFLPCAPVSLHSEATLSCGCRSGGLQSPFLLVGVPFVASGPSGGGGGGEDHPMIILRNILTHELSTLGS